MRRAPANHKSQLQIKLDHRMVAFPRVGHDHSKTLLLRIFNLPLLELRAKALSAKVGENTGGHNVQAARPGFVVEIRIAQKRRTPDDLSIHNHPVRFEFRPFLVREQVGRKAAEYFLVNFAEQLELLRYHDLPELSSLVSGVRLHFG